MIANGKVVTDAATVERMHLAARTLTDTKWAYRYGVTRYADTADSGIVWQVRLYDVTGPIHYVLTKFDGTVVAYCHESHLCHLGNAS